MKYKRIESLDEIKQDDWIYMIESYRGIQRLFKVICIDNGKFGFETMGGFKNPRLISSDKLLNDYDTFYKLGE